MTKQIHWVPLFLNFPHRSYAFGGTLIHDLLHKQNLPEGPLAETWEVSDYVAPGAPESDSATVQNGDLAGQTLRHIVRHYPQELMGKGWQGPHFPLLAKFLDASKMLPVHLHANDAVAQQRYAQPNGKTEAWHILWAAPGATILAGVKPGVSPAELRLALQEGRYDDVMPRYPIVSGDTVYIAGGVLHSFGPDALVYEIQQTSDLGTTAMPHDLYGRPLSAQEWQRNLDTLLEELVWEPQPGPVAGLTLPALGAERRVCALGPYFALERLKLSEGYTWNFATAQIVTALAEPLNLLVGAQQYSLSAAQSVVLPAVLGQATLQGQGKGQGEALVSYVPDVGLLAQQLRAAGHAPEAIAALGEVELP